MREGNFEVLVYDAQTNALFPEKIIDGIPYVITEPGQEYYVQVSVHRTDLYSSWDYKYIRVGLYVDGFDVAYWKRLDFTESIVETSTVVHGNNFFIIKVIIMLYFHGFA